MRRREGTHADLSPGAAGLDGLEQGGSGAAGTRVHIAQPVRDVVADTLGSFIATHHHRGQPTSQVVGIAPALPLDVLRELRVEAHGIMIVTPVNPFAKPEFRRRP
jgi:hypothetical protein